MSRLVLSLSRERSVAATLQNVEAVLVIIANCPNVAVESNNCIMLLGLLGQEFDMEFDTVGL